MNPPLGFAAGARLRPLLELAARGVVSVLVLAPPVFSLEKPSAKEAAIYVPAHDWDAVASLPRTWGLKPPGWRYAKRLALHNETRHDRRREPVEAEVEFHAEHITDLAREVLVARVVAGGRVAEGHIDIVPSQVHLIAREDELLRCRLFFLADVVAGGSTMYLVLFGNPDAPEPEHKTDLSVVGEGYALEVENDHYRAVLGALNGNWKSLYPKSGSAKFVGAGPPMYGGHGVEGTIHWGPDWSDERVGRYRLTGWDGPPLFDYEVIRGSVCLRVSRWGHPILSIGPQVGRPHKVMASVTYTFWSGQPYIIMESKLEVLEDIRFRDCRNDEFVIGGGLPEAAWMGPDGVIGLGGKTWRRQDPRWMTYFDRATGQGFGSVHLEYENTNPHWPAPASVGFSDTGIWVRYPVQHAAMRAGDHVSERNAYVLHRFEEGAEHGGFADLVGIQQRLLAPLTQGEAPPALKPVSVDNAMDALRATNEFELYVQGSPWGPRQLSFVDIGVVRDVAVDGNDLRVDIVMPYAGRETWFGWFADKIEEQFRDRLSDVGDVDVQLVSDPEWTPAQMSDRARRTIGPGDH